ncbi:hypothetical protein [Actinoplanes regularis]|uniref:Uncharacterized protein n=1 Tax=Actinoplanes regularis TaxID=52697 RepID=A0A238XJB7_9ACTN|nr:hypothetical protein [Actinoplanes regularis]GIE90502.1 hypothetical protein Are01nite_69820 [Actinoplanes regularis]SNR58792.1 hypothetical protein SAMN06264365_103494 [Actinoplanes regularis]
MIDSLRGGGATPAARRHPVTGPAQMSLAYAGLLPEHARTQALPSLPAVPGGDAYPDMLWSSPFTPPLWSTAATPSTGTTPEPATALDDPAPDGVALTGVDWHWALPIEVGGVTEQVAPVTRWAPNHWGLSLR